MKIHFLLVLAPLAGLVACQPPASSTDEASVEAPTVAAEIDLEKIQLTDEETVALTDDQIEQRIAYLIKMADARTEEDRAGDKEYQEKYADAIVIDALTVGAPDFPGIGFTSEQFQSMVDERYTGVAIDAMSTTMSNGSETFAPAYARMDALKAFEENGAGKYRIVLSVDDLHEAKDQGQFAIIINSQSSDILDEDVRNVQKFYDKGLRQLNFTYNVTNHWSDGMASNAEGATDNGLSEAGEQLVAEMNRVGMVVDCSHSSDQTCIEAANLTDKPMIASHSNPSALMGIPRNTSDEAIKAVAATGGAICLNFLGGFLNPEGNASPSDIAKHVEHIKQLVGAEATCAGSDYVHNYGFALDPIIRNPSKYPPSTGYGSVTQMGFPQDLWGVARVLEEQYGWTESEIRGFLGENVIRIYEANWK